MQQVVKREVSNLYVIDKCCLLSYTDIYNVFYTILCSNLLNMVVPECLLYHFCFSLTLSYKGVLTFLHVGTVFLYLGSSFLSLYSCCLFTLVCVSIEYVLKVESFEQSKNYASLRSYIYVVSHIIVC